MKTLYFSDVTNQTYNTKEDCVKAEAEFLKAKAEKEAKSKKRADASKDVEKAILEAKKAQKVAEDKLTAFCKEFGPYHASFSTDDAADLVDRFFTHWFF